MPASSSHHPPSILLMIMIIITVYIRQVKPRGTTNHLSGFFGGVPRSRRRPLLPVSAVRRAGWPSVMPRRRPSLWRGRFAYMAGRGGHVGDPQESVVVAQCRNRCASARDIPGIRALAITGVGVHRRQRDLYRLRSTLSKRPSRRDGAQPYLASAASMIRASRLASTG